MIIITQSNDDDNFFSGSFYTDNVVAPSPTGSIQDFSNITGNNVDDEHDDRNDWEYL